MGKTDGRRPQTAAESRVPGPSGAEKTQGFRAELLRGPHFRACQEALRQQGHSSQQPLALEVAVNAASVVDEAQPLENAVQDVAHTALREKGFLQELAHVDLVHVAHEANVGR